MDSSDASELLSCVTTVADYTGTCITLAMLDATPVEQCATEVDLSVLIVTENTSYI